MPIRNTHRVGDWLMLDDESGAVYYRSEMRKIWNSTYRHVSQFETRQPQEFVRAKRDPKALRAIRPEPDFAISVSGQPILVGESNVLTKTNGPGSHLYPTIIFTTDPAIPDMEIEASAASNPFIVRLGKATEPEFAGGGVAIPDMEIGAGAVPESFIVR